jgi:transposase-like protein
VKTRAYTSWRLMLIRMAIYTAGRATSCDDSGIFRRAGATRGPSWRRLAQMASNDKRRADVLEALERTGSMRGAARATGVGERTLYRWRERDGRFRVAAERRLTRHRQQLAERLEAHCADVALHGARIEVLDRDGQTVELRRHDQRALDRALDRWAGWGQGSAQQLAPKAYHLELDGRELAAGLAAVFAAGLAASHGSEAPREVQAEHQGDHDSARPLRPRLGADRGAGDAAERRGKAGQHSRGEGGVPRDARGGGGYKYIPHTPHIPPGLTGPKTS